MSSAGKTHCYGTRSYLMHDRYQGYVMNMMANRY